MLVEASRVRNKSFEIQQRGTWIGPEVTVIEAVEFKPGQQGTVLVNVGELREQIPPEHLTGLELIGRSRLAQIGGAVSPRGGRRLRHAIGQPDSPDVVDIDFTNYSHAPLAVGTESVAKLVVRHGPDATGEQLLDLLAKGKIRVKGEEGQDWWLHTTRTGYLVGIGLVLAEEEFWIPDRDTPVQITGETRGTFRKELDKYLEPVTPETRPRLLIGQTLAALGTALDIFGIIDPAIGPHSDSAPENVLIVNAEHINAPGLYGGDDWEIRTETQPPRKLKVSKRLPRKAVVATFQMLRD